MSVTEILDELPKLTPAELDAILHRIEEIHSPTDLDDDSPELHAAIEEALAAPESEDLVLDETTRERIHREIHDLAHNGDATAA